MLDKKKEGEDLKIKRTDDKPMVIHAKEKARLHVNPTIEVNIKHKEHLTVTNGSKVAEIKSESGTKTLINRGIARKITIQKRKNTNLKKGKIEVNPDKGKNIKQAVRANNKQFTIHTKEKPRLHIKPASKLKIKSRNYLTTARGPKIAEVKAKNTTKSIDKSRSIKQAVQKENSLQKQHKPIINVKKDRELDIDKKHTFIKAARAISSKAALNQLEGGDELYESAMIISSITKPITNTAKTTKNLYRRHTANSQTQNHIKKVNPAKSIGKKAIKDTAIKKARKATKEIAKKATKETVKTTVKITAKVAGTVEGTATTGAGGILIGAATGEVISRKMDKQNIKNSSRSRLIKLFIAKLRQEDNQDSIAKALKDIVMMRFSILIKKVVAYAALLLFLLFILVALVALTVIVVIAVIYNSPLAIFFPSISSEDTTQQVLSAYISDFNREINTELSQYSGYDRSEKVYVNYKGFSAPDTIMTFLQFTWSDMGMVMLQQI